MKELEVRILNVDIDIIKSKLKKIKAVKVKQENQINEIFDFPDRKLINSKGYARIRTIEDKLSNKTYFFMTVKKLITQQKYKIMDENEVMIDNAEEGRNIFKSLGLELVQSIKKYRESYKIKNSLVEIDINDKNFCPFPYIEVESPKEDELKEIVNLLGYKMKDTTSKTIYEILKERGLN